MEILENAVIIPCTFNRSALLATLKIPGKVLFDIYTSGKRCLCKMSNPVGDYVANSIFEIISAFQLVAEDTVNYTFLAVMINDPNAEFVMFKAAGIINEPTYRVEI